MEKTQPIQNSQYSQYARGVVTGALAAGTLVIGLGVIFSPPRSQSTQREYCFLRALSVCSVISVVKK
jgi:hypothetical protein